MKLILWDIDGTLLHTGGVAADVMRGAMEQVFGPVIRRERIFYSGKTDWQIIHDTFPHLSRDVVGEQMGAFRLAYVAGLERRRADMVARSGTMPGITAVLARLHELAIQAPLTGNIAPIARLKLEILDLLEYLNPDIGAYGDDHYERMRLVPIAVERATQFYGRPFGGGDVVIIGDTPKDIDCGRHNEARTVAVATGPYSLDELHACQPDAVLPDLSDIEAALAAILGN